MKQPSEPIFLERRRYRRRRLGDAARLLPALGAVVFCLPLLWGATAKTANGVLFVFCGWALLIIVAGLMARPLADPDDTRHEE